MGLLVLSVLLQSFLPVVMADSLADSTWVNNKGIKVTNTGDYQAGDPFYSGLAECYPTPFKIQKYEYEYSKNNWFEIPSVTYTACATQTPLGLVGTINGATYIQFSGDAYAQRLVNGSADLKTYVVPGEKALLVVLPISSSEYSIRVYYNIRAVGDSIIQAGERKFQVNSFPDQLRDDKGKTLQLDQIAVSRSGGWVTARVSNGAALMRLHVPTKTLQTFAKAFPWTTVGYHMAVTNDGRYVFVQQGEGFVTDQFMYDLQGCVPNSSATMTIDVAPGCTRRNIAAQLKSQISGFKMLQGAKFNYDGQKLSALARYQLPTDTTYPNGLKYVDITNADYIEHSTSYLALGDSFASGEGDTHGAEWYEPGTDVQRVNICHVSRRSYPYLIAHQLGLLDDITQSPAGDSQFHSVACSGAKSNHVLQDIQYYDASEPEWLSGSKVQNEWVNLEKPEALTISMIGNDIGFGKIIARCIEPDTCYDSYEDRMELALLISRKFNDLTNMYQELKNKSPATRFYVLGYPQIISEAGPCGLNTPLNQREREFAVGLTHYLNSVIEAAAKYSGVRYVDVEHSLAGKELCSGEPQKSIAVNGITAGNDRLLVIGAESFHPNATAQPLYAEDIMQQTNSLTLPMPAADQNVTIPVPTSPEFTKLLNAPKTGRQLHTVNYDDDLSNNIVYRGGVEKFALDNLHWISPYKLLMHSDPIDLGTYESNENGEIEATFNLPADTPIGFHTLHLIGPSASGGTVDYQKVVYVAASPDDFDGDGILNEDEKCGILEPSGVDVDVDGIDDACDTDIGEPPVVDTPEPEPEPVDPEIPPQPKPELPADGEQLPPDESQPVDPSLCYKLQTCNTYSSPQSGPVATVTQTDSKPKANLVVATKPLVAAQGLVASTQEQSDSTPQVAAATTTTGSISTAQPTNTQTRATQQTEKTWSPWLILIIGVLALLGLAYPAWRASRR